MHIYTYSNIRTYVHPLHTYAPNTHMCLLPTDSLSHTFNTYTLEKKLSPNTNTQSYSGLRGAVAFSLALARLHGEPSLDHPTTCMIQSEAQLRKTMLTAITFLVLFTVFVQVQPHHKINIYV